MVGCLGIWSTGTRSGGFEAAGVDFYETVAFVLDERVGIGGLAPAEEEGAVQAEDAIEEIVERTGFPGISSGAHWGFEPSTVLWVGRP